MRVHPPIDSDVVAEYYFLLLFCRLLGQFKLKIWQGTKRYYRIENSRKCFEDFWEEDLEFQRRSGYQCCFQTTLPNTMIIAVNFCQEITRYVLIL